MFDFLKNISDFRNEYDMLKSRTANNFHHAHDAYLNVVVGRAINTYYEVNRIFGQKDILKLQNEKKALNPMTIVKKNIYDYAKEANNKAFESYSSYISMSEEARSSYVMDCGEPKPFMFSVVTKEMQQKLLEEEEKDDNGLRAMYKKRKGNLND